MLKSLIGLPSLAEAEYMHNELKFIQCINSDLCQFESRAEPI